MPTDEQTELRATSFSSETEPQAGATTEEPYANGQRPGRRSASSRSGSRAGCWPPVRHHPVGHLAQRYRGLGRPGGGERGASSERHQDNLVLELLHGGRWAGHPLHPALSDLPIGLWTGVMVLDAADRGPAPRRGIDAAGVLSAAGILAASATALTGLSDWTVSNDQDRRVGLFHGLLNTVALGLQCASLGTRVAGRHSTARALGAASLTVTAAAG